MIQVIIHCYRHILLVVVLSGGVGQRVLSFTSAMNNTTDVDDKSCVRHTFKKEAETDKGTQSIGPIEADAAAYR
jgi:hypothetical protein